MGTVKDRMADDATGTVESLVSELLNVPVHIHNENVFRFGMLARRSYIWV